MSEHERTANMTTPETPHDIELNDAGAPIGSDAEAITNLGDQRSVETPVLRLVREEADELDEPPTPDSEIGVYIFRPAGDDRRKHRRFRVMRPGKVFRRATQQFQSVESRDLSFSGALLSIVTLTPYKVGEIVDLGLAMNKASVVPSKSLLQGIVVRAEAITQGRQEIAVRYIPSVAQAA